MTGTSRLLVGAALAVSALAWCPRAAAQERAPIGGYEYLPEERWGKLAPDDDGKPYYLEGRWHQLYGDWVLLFNGPINTRGFLWVSPRSAALKQVLAADKDSGGRGLRKKRSSVRIFGRAKKGASSVALQIERVEKLADESEQFLERLEAAGEDVAAVQALGRECAVRAERFGDEALAGVGRRIVARELELQTARLDASDHEGRLALAERYLAEVEEAAGAIRLYAQLLEKTASLPAPVRARVLARLDQLKAVRAQRDGEWTWLPYAEFKQAEGFIRVQTSSGQTWVRAEAVEFAAVRAAELEQQKRTLALPRSNENKHAKDARQGRITRGQTFAEVRIAGGLPVHVRHHLQPYLQAEKDAVWTQWILEDGRRVYFAEGEVVTIREASEAWLRPAQ